MLKKYELIFIIDLVESIDKIKSYIHELLKSYSINVLETKDIVEQKFSYIIDKKPKGYYYYLTVELDNSKNILSDFSKELLFNKDILRFLNFIIPKEKKKIKQVKKVNFEHKRFDRNPETEETKAEEEKEEKKVEEEKEEKKVE